MADATILLASGDQHLTNQVHTITGPIARVELISLKEVDSIYSYSDWSGVGLVLIHHTKEGSALQIARLLGMIAASRRPAAVVVVGEAFDQDQKSAYHRMGVVDCVELPQDQLRLAHLCHILTLQQRGGIAPPVGIPDRSVPGTVVVADSDPSLAWPEPTESILDGSSSQVQTIIDLVRRAAPHNATVLLGGETGTGKTHLARHIHTLSNRRDEPFVTINCGSTSNAVIEGDLFGHVRGAFEGAIADRVGKFAEAGRGTLFLDGIEALPLPIQAKLLKVIEDRSFEPIGGNQPQPLMARLIAASNRPLDEEIGERRFRSDLFYRLNVIGLQLPPLRERRDAIPLLANRFLQECGESYGRSFETLGVETIEALQKHDWPGNVRELRNVFDRCAATCPDRLVRREDLPDDILNSVPHFGNPGDPLYATVCAAGPASLAVTKGQAELARITEALQKHSNNRLRAAVELKISRMTLYKKLYKYGLMDPPTRAVNLVTHS